MTKLLKNCCYGMLFALGMWTNNTQGRRPRRCGACVSGPVHPDPCCARNVGRVNPYYYLYRGWFRTYNWRMTPLTVERLLGPQAFMGPSS